VNTIPNTRTTLCGPVSGVARATGTRHPSKSIIDHHTRPLRRTGGSSILPSGARAFDRDQAVEVLNSSKPLS
jgi:hypothetical protein